MNNEEKLEVIKKLSELRATIVIDDIEKWEKILKWAREQSFFPFAQDIGITFEEMRILFVPEGFLKGLYKQISDLAYANEKLEERNETIWNEIKNLIEKEKGLKQTIDEKDKQIGDLLEIVRKK